jgi:hypothetical protein
MAHFVETFKKSLGAAGPRSHLLHDFLWHAEKIERVIPKASYWAGRRHKDNAV